MLLLAGETGSHAVLPITLAREGVVWCCNPGRKMRSAVGSYGGPIETEKVMCCCMHNPGWKDKSHGAACCPG